ncbi:Cof-type HAD-IIB family hydrolase [Vibrio parahaemolyticus]|uniref:Cof-type HAD-IIB family hydrolase n=1 Tax=Vibrio parahaemolyticus TaxID=670 RepID=UPI00044C5A28|nr:Cof-type HAD-IIB family hydrolase [Vibrio parahaemolyticus]EGQ7948414.1 Cof-type HAD-IIB family hydrolase [Vibrio parahaemolyticus]EHH2462073.1 Cof-type HAD-IIB family hydrolase [Vibrio parahaemolyticus]EHH2510994.1 Cof-type HAD-IIB family hydrolase [Vibrio parahaemolyticus]ELA9293881.1 Cof-type HAD-IIB family hydrolase [Vibrio parahaemolyticus]EXJ30188.1 HAD hydrolase, IIB family protein [Vibrio parahaemolyticus VPTS-2009]
MYKLIALDMDGTLLNSDKSISEENKQAIAKARKAGVTVVLASGRPLEGMQAKLDELNIDSDKDFVLFYNGSMVKNVGTNEIIHQQILDGKAAKLVARKAKELGAYVHAFSQVHGLITNENNPYTDIEANINGLNVTEMNFEALEDDHPIIKTMMVAEPSKLTEVIAALPPEMREEFTVVQSAPFFLEFLNPASNKGIGVAAIAEYLGIQPEEVICMGDAENDHHMLQYAGLGIAMANAMEETKKIADYITESNDDHGVAKAIEKFVLNA